MRPLPSVRFHTGLQLTLAFVFLLPLSAREAPMSLPAWRSEVEVCRKEAAVLERVRVKAERSLARVERHADAGRATESELRAARHALRKAQVDEAVALCRIDWARTGLNLAGLGAAPADEIEAVRLRVQLWEWRLKEARLLRDYALELTAAAENDYEQAKRLRDNGQLSDEALSLAKGRFTAAQDELNRTEEEVRRVEAVVRNGGRPVAEEPLAAPLTPGEVERAVTLEGQVRDFKEQKKILEEARLLALREEKTFRENKLLHEKGLLSAQELARSEAAYQSARERVESLQADSAKAAGALVREALPESEKQ